MRIAIANSTFRHAGGAETYLGMVVADLHRRGHTVGILEETDAPLSRARVTLPPGTSEWDVTKLGRRTALMELGRWEPDVIYVNILSDPGLEAELQSLGPTIFFAHAYHGTCI